MHDKQKHYQDLCQMINSSRMLICMTQETGLDISERCQSQSLSDDVNKWFEQ